MGDDRPPPRRKRTRASFPLPFPRGDSEGFRRGMPRWSGAGRTHPIDQVSQRSLPKGPRRGGSRTAPASQTRTRTPTNNPFSLDETFAQPRHLSWAPCATPTSVMGPLRNPNICRGTFAQLQHLSLSFRTQRSGVRNLKPMFSKRRFAA